MMKRIINLKFISIGMFFLIAFSCQHRRSLKNSKNPTAFCLASGTPVRLANGKDLPIENLIVGDTILGFDRAKNSFVPSVVKKIFSTQHAGFSNLNFSAAEGISEHATTSLTLSNDHPIWIKRKGWCSLEPEITKRALSMKSVQQLVVNDTCITMDANKNVSEKTIFSIAKISGIVKAYTIVQLENNLDCFLAGGIVVGTEPTQLENGGE